MPPPAKRCFIALPLPPHIRATLAGLHEQLESYKASLSFPHPDDSHLTLLFLGFITTATMEQVIPIQDRVGAAFPAFAMGVGGGGYFGSKHYPRVLWVGVAAPQAMTDLQRSLYQAVAYLGVPLEYREFYPHITVARIRHPPPPGALTSMVHCINNTPFAEVPVDRILFMNSQLNGSGPRYTIIHETLLKGAPHHG